MSEEAQAEVLEAVASQTEAPQVETIENESQPLEAEKTSEDLALDDDSKGVKKRLGIMARQRNEARADAIRYKQQYDELSAITQEQRESLSPSEIAKLSAKEALLEDKIESSNAKIQQVEADEWAEKVSTIDGYSNIVDTALADKAHPIQNISKGLVDYLKEIEGGELATMAICEDRELCKKILNASPLVSARMIEKIIDARQASLVQTEAPKAKIGTTPKPGSSGAVASKIEVHKMSTAQYIEHMNKIEASKKRIY